jgi:uncharacterized protein
VTVRLRSHHLLCLLTYAGKGYGATFTANFSAIADRIGKGEEILMVTGPDDICAPLLDQPESHCSGESVCGRDHAAARDVEALLGRSVCAGTRFALTAGDLSRMRDAFATGRIRAACEGCQWRDLCSGIVQTCYRGARLCGPA